MPDSFAQQQQPSSRHHHQHHSHLHQARGPNVPYQTTERLADPFVESSSPVAASLPHPSSSSSSSHFKRPPTPTTDDRWRDDTLSATSSPRSATSDSPAQGSKRTASGQVKVQAQQQHASTTATPSSRPRSYHGHKRTPSNESAVGNIGQLSEQLKTRLSYAMVKVQNGWETCSIGEVESLASQLGSPMSTSSPFPRNHKSSSLTSPRIAMANVNRRSRDLSQITSSQQQHMYPMSPPDAPLPPSSSSSSSRRRSLMQPPTMGPLSTSPTRAMEHHHHHHHQPSLAPPMSFDRSRRDMATSHSDYPKSSSSSHSRPSHPRPKTPTPQEQDAVDTLLFMSSPANSQLQFPHATSTVQPSPLRPAASWGSGSAASQHGPSSQPRPSWATTRTGSNLSSGDESIADADADADAATAASDESRNTDRERQAKRRSYGLLKSDRDVERLLNEMNDASSDEEEEEEGQDEQREGEAMEDVKNEHREQREEGKKKKEKNKEQDGNGGGGSNGSSSSSSSRNGGSKGQGSGSGSASASRTEAPSSTSHSARGPLSETGPPTTSVGHVDVRV